MVKISWNSSKCKIKHIWFKLPSSNIQKQSFRSTLLHLNRDCIQITVYPWRTAVHTTRMNNGLFVFGEKFCLCCAAYLQGSPSRMHSARQCSKDANFGLLPPFGQKLVYVLPLREVRKHNQWIPNLAVRFSLGMFSEHPLSSPEAKHAARAGNTGLACWFWVFGKRFVWDYRKTNSLKTLIKIKFPRILHCCATTILEQANLAFPLKQRKTQKLTCSAHVVSNFGATLVVSVSRVLLPSRTLKKSVKDVTFVLGNPK